MNTKEILKTAVDSETSLRVLVKHDPKYDKEYVFSQRVLRRPKYNGKVGRVIGYSDSYYGLCFIVRFSFLKFFKVVDVYYEAEELTIL